MTTARLCDYRSLADDTPGCQPVQPPERADSKRGGRRPPLCTNTKLFNSRELQSREQLIVRRCRRDTLDQPLHRGLWRHLRQPATQRVHTVELVRSEQLLLAPRSARRDVDRGIDALLGEAAIELDLAVTRALELLEDHVVHAR